MSFSSESKHEIIENKPLRQRFNLELSYGFFLFCPSFDEESIAFTTESTELRSFFIQQVKKLLKPGVEVIKTEAGSASRRLYTVAIKNPQDCRELISKLGAYPPINAELLNTPEKTGAFLAGAYLSCGNMSDPQKHYHLEFVTKAPGFCLALTKLLDEAIPGVKHAVRRASHIAYYKDCKQIEDLLTLMGASRSSLALIDVEMIKEVRNRANRATNCDTANINKTAAAAAAQIADIELIYSALGRDKLPEDLQIVGDIRLENPDSSLRELLDMLPEKQSRSSLYRKLSKLSEIAQGLRNRYTNIPMKGP